MRNDETIMAPTHPGLILREEFLEPMGITDYQSAKHSGTTGPDQRHHARQTP